jgi:dipeptidase E
MNLLLLSNSTNHDAGYLGHCASQIDEFLGDVRDVLLIPYAAVSRSYEEYEEMAQNALSVFGIQVHSIHHEANPVEAIEKASAIAVAGGNTFRLLDLLYAQNLIEPIRRNVKKGMPYVGWSAGSNVAGATICTTNDMPIVQPPSFNAIGLVDFQINPHYTDRVINEHNGESRSQRLTEFTELNRDTLVMALPEGSWLKQKAGYWTYEGEDKLVVFSYGKPINYMNTDQAERYLNQ